MGDIPRNKIANPSRVNRDRGTPNPVEVARMESRQLRRELADLKNDYEAVRAENAVLAARLAELEGNPLGERS